jgi:hypothetical protein
MQATKPSTNSTMTCKAAAAGFNVPGLFADDGN